MSGLIMWSRFFSGVNKLGFEIGSLSIGLCVEGEGRGIDGKDRCVWYNQVITGGI